MPTEELARRTNWSSIHRTRPDRKRAEARVVQESFWLTAARESFTAQAQKYFDEHRPPQTADSMLGVTLQHAQRNGTL